MAVVTFPREGRGHLQHRHCHLQEVKGALGLLVQQSFQLDTAAVGQMVIRGQIGTRNLIQLVMMKRSKSKTKITFLWKLLLQLAEGIYLISHHS